MFPTKLVRSYIPPAILGLTLFVIYMRTLAPGLTWANDGADGGDLITAAAVGGVPHPSGYPLYNLLARLFQLVPIGSLAWRTNLLSTAAAILAALVIYSLVARLAASSRDESGWLPGLVSGFALGLSPLFWSQAVITEVYTLQALLAALILYLSILPDPPGREAHKDRLRGSLLGLALGSHLTSLLLLPILLMRSGSRSSILRHLTFFFIGSLIYLLLPLQALADPPVNWGDPVTPARFWWLVSGQLYRVSLLPLAEGGFWARLQGCAAVLLRQFWLPGLLAGISGFVFFIPARSRIMTLYTLAAYTIFAVIYGINDSSVYLIPAFIAFAIWIGLAAAGMMRLVPRIGWVIPCILLISFFALSALNLPRVDASGDARAENFGAQVMQEAPPDAILFAKGDRAVFALWYFHLALHERSDLAVIAEELLHYDWYQETLRSVYPSLVIRGPFPWPETIMSLNPRRPACFVEYRDQTMIDCVEE